MAEVVCKVEAELIPRLLKILESYGSYVHRDEPLAGRVTHQSGRLAYRYVEGELRITVTHNAGHFSTLMLQGGIRQLVEETAELARREALRAAFSIDGDRFRFEHA